MSESMADRLREKQIVLDCRIEELRRTVKERDSLRSRVAELEDELSQCKVGKAMMMTRIAAWEPVVSKACSLEGIEEDDLWERRCDEIEIAAADIPPEHRPEVEP